MQHKVSPDGNCAYVDAGAGEEVVLLLHGLGSRGSDWRQQIVALAGAYRVIAPDLRGHGASRAPGGHWRMADLAGDIFALLNQLAIRRVHVVGFSLGGMVALEMANRRPHRLASLCLINSQPFPGRKPRALLLAYWMRRLIISLFGLQTMGRVIGNKLFPEPDQHAVLERFVAQMARMSKPAYLAALDAIYHWDITPQFASLGLPVMILAADQDYTPVQAKRAFAAHFSQCQFHVIANSRHATPLDQVERVNFLLSSFLTTTIKAAQETP